MKNVTKTNVVFTATVLVYLILVYTIRLIPAGTFSLNFLLILPEIILLLPSILYLAFMKDESAGGCGVEKVSVTTGFLSVIFALCIIPAISLINMVSSMFVENSVDATLTRTVNSNPLIINLILLALVPAVVEEFIFRGLIFNGYKKRNPLVAAILSAVLFGLIHMNINQFSYAFVVGILFAFLTYVTGSIVPSTIAHFIINGNSVVLSHILQWLQNKQSVTGNVTGQPMDETSMYLIVYGVIGAMAVIGIVIAVFIFRAICKKNRGFESFKMIFKKPMRNTFDATQGRFFDGYLLLGLGICVAYIVMYEIL